MPKAPFLIVAAPRNDESKITVTILGPQTGDLGRVLGALVRLASGGDGSIPNFELFLQCDIEAAAH